MKDKWLNVGYDGDELKPHVEPVEDYNDTSRIGERRWGPLPYLALGMTLDPIHLLDSLAVICQPFSHVLKTQQHLLIYKEKA